jgi:hypothetical protein
MAGGLAKRIPKAGYHARGQAFPDTKTRDIMGSEGPPEGVKIVLKFSRGQQVVLKEGKFVSLRGENVSELNERLGLEDDLIVHSLFGVSPEEFEQPVSSDETPDLSRYYTVVVKDAGRAKALATDLNKMSFIEEAEPEPPTYLAI